MKEGPFMNSKIKFNALFVIGATIGGACLTQQPSLAWNCNGFVNHHPRRAEVLTRDNIERNELRADRGNLGGHYGQLMHEDRSIRRQEQRDASMNGGHITRGEQNHLNREENRLQRQTNRDFR
jgi:hypothetical protein